MNNPNDGHAGVMVVPGPAEPASPPPAESAACYLLQSAWVDGRNRIDSAATIAAFASEDAAVGAFMAEYARAYGEKDMRRKARSGKLIVKVRPMSARELANLAALAGAIAEPKGVTDEPS